MNILRQVSANLSERKPKARSPVLRDPFQIFRHQPVIARLLKCPNDVFAIVPRESLFADRPEREDERLARSRNPFLRQIERKVARAIDL